VTLTTLLVVLPSSKLARIFLTAYSLFDNFTTNIAITIIPVLSESTCIHVLSIKSYKWYSIVEESYKQ